MNADKRRESIVTHMLDAGAATVDELATQFKVSRMTIHRDLDELAKEGWLRKTRGGASVLSDTQFESDFLYRKRIASEEKSRIAAAAVELIEPDDSVMLGYGSTVLHLLPYLEKLGQVTVASPSLPCIEALANMRGVELLSCGGKYEQKFAGFFGLNMERCVQSMMMDILFISSSAITLPEVYHQDQTVVRAKQVMLENARKKYLLADSSKFGKTALYRLGNISLFDGVITGEPLPENDEKALTDRGVEVIYACG